MQFGLSILFCICFIIQMWETFCNQKCFPGANPFWNGIFIEIPSLSDCQSKLKSDLFVHEMETTPCQVIVLFHNTQSNDAHIIHKLYISLYVMNRLMGGAHILYCIEKLKDYPGQFNLG